MDGVVGGFHRVGIGVIASGKKGVSSAHKSKDQRVGGALAIVRIET